MKMNVSNYYWSLEIFWLFWRWPRKKWHIIDILMMLKSRWPNWNQRRIFLIHGMFLLKVYAMLLPSKTVCTTNIRAFDWSLIKKVSIEDIALWVLTEIYWFSCIFDLINATFDPVGMASEMIWFFITNGRFFSDQKVSSSARNGIQCRNIKNGKIARIASWPLAAFTFLAVILLTGIGEKCEPLGCDVRVVAERRGVVSVRLKKHCLLFVKNESLILMLSSSRHTQSLVRFLISQNDHTQRHHFDSPETSSLTFWLTDTKRSNIFTYKS